MLKYTTIFAAIYLVVTALVAVVLTWFDSGAGTVINLAVTGFAATYAAARFVRDRGRAPAMREQLIFSVQALAAACVASTLLVAAAWSVVLPDVPPRDVAHLFGRYWWLVAFAAAIVCTLYFGVIFASFALASTHYVKRLSPRGEAPR